MLLKKCSSCKVEKGIENFNKNRTKKDGFGSVCRSCSNLTSKLYYEKDKETHKTRVSARNKKIRAEHSQKLRDIKASGCSCCSEKEACCLDFHHLRDKKDGVGRMVGHRSSWRNIEKEINKCILLCSNCHRKLHAGLISL